MTIAIIFEVDAGDGFAHPRQQQLHDEAHGQRRQHAVRPDHLRFAAGGAIFLRLLLKPRVGENAKAPEAWPARGRPDELAADRELIAEDVNVQATLETGYHPTAAEHGRASCRARGG